MNIRSILKKSPVSKATVEEFNACLAMARLAKSSKDVLKVLNFSLPPDAKSEVNQALMKNPSQFGVMIENGSKLSSENIVSLLETMEQTWREGKGWEYSFAYMENNNSLYFGSNLRSEGQQHSKISKKKITAMVANCDCFSPEQKERLMKLKLTGFAANLGLVMYEKKRKAELPR